MTSFPLQQNRLTPTPTPPSIEPKPKPKRPIQTKQQSPTPPTIEPVIEPSVIIEPKQPVIVIERTRIITLELIRKRSEHNEGLVSNLTEIALHQEELTSIGPLLHRTSPTLKILLLQNNVIHRMHPSHLRHFTCMEYLNLALNNITMVEGVEHMEHLMKLDLTLNFVNVCELERSVANLRECRSLKELYLLGNPCMNGSASASGGSNGSGNGDKNTKNTEEEGVTDISNLDKDDIEYHQTPSSSSVSSWNEADCRMYIIAHLPQLSILDGKEITNTERIQSRQQSKKMQEKLQTAIKLHRIIRDIDSIPQDQDINGNDVQEEGEESESISTSTTTRHCPSDRLRISHEMAEQKATKEKNANANAPQFKGEKEWQEEHVQRKRKEEDKYGDADVEVKVKKGVDEEDVATRIKQCNEGRWQYHFSEIKKPTTSASTSTSTARHSKSTSTHLTLSLVLPKHLSSNLIHVDIHPTYISIIIKSKVLRLKYPCEIEVHSEQSTAERSMTTGHLLIVMPIMKVEVDGNGNDNYHEYCNIIHGSASKNDSNSVVPSSASAETAAAAAATTTSRRKSEYIRGGMHQEMLNAAQAHEEQTQTQTQKGVKTKTKAKIVPHSDSSMPVGPVCLTGIVKQKSSSSSPLSSSLSLSPLTHSMDALMVERKTTRKQVHMSKSDDDSSYVDNDDDDDDDTPPPIF